MKFWFGVNVSGCVMCGVSYDNHRKFLGWCHYTKEKEEEERGVKFIADAKRAVDSLQHIEDDLPPAQRASVEVLRMSVYRCLTKEHDYK